MRFRTIDAHTAGEPLRLIVEGWPAPEGQTMLERRTWAYEYQDHLRRVLMLEPRGHADMYGALLTEPERPDSDAGVLFMHNAGFSTMCGHGIIAVVTIAVERGLISRADFAPVAGGRTDIPLTLDAPAGQIRARAHVNLSEELPRVERVSFINVPSFVLAHGVGVAVNGRQVPCDVAFGGAFYAIVDAESAGLPVAVDRLGDLRRTAEAIKRAVEACVKVVHPTESSLEGIYGVIFTSPPAAPGADLRNVTVLAEQEVDRSPSGTGP